MQNWTSGLMEEFEQLNGYDMKPFLPVLAGGFIVGSYENAERFLWDFRKTLSYLIQKGCFNHLAELARADVLCFLGEDVPTYLGFRNELPVPLPDGYDYDGCNADILLNHARVSNGKIVLDSGMEYKYLLMPAFPSISLDILKKIEELDKNGATVIGPKPIHAPDPFLLFFLLAANKPRSLPLQALNLYQPGICLTVGMSWNFAKQAIMNWHLPTIRKRLLMCFF